VVESRLECARRHRFPEVEGVFDLLGDGARGGLDLFGSPYGWLYDHGVKERGLATLAARLLFGADISELFEMMDAGVRCDPGQLVLDVACGGAPSLRTAAGRMRGTYVGVDLSAAMLARAAAMRREEGLGGVVLLRGDATDLPLQDGCADRALCFNGLHVMPDKAAVLAELARVLKPGGQCWGNYAARPGAGPTALLRPWLGVGFGGGFFHPADPDELKATARAAGFSSWRQHRSGSIVFFRGHIAG
jgi:SAM-dependent methyltransferase